MNLSTQIVSDNSFNDVKYCVGVYANDFTFHNLYEITTVNRVDYEIEIEFTKIWCVHEMNESKVTETEDKKIEKIS